LALSYLISFILYDTFVNYLAVVLSIHRKHWFWIIGFLFVWFCL